MPDPSGTPRGKAGGGRPSVLLKSRAQPPTGMEEPQFQGAFQGGQELLPLVGPFQAILQVFHCRLRLREICIRHQNSPWDREEGCPRFATGPGGAGRGASQPGSPRMMPKSSSMRIPA